MSSSLLGRPDFFFPSPKVALFADVDFWHSWRFPAWKRRHPKFWKEKIERIGSRDQRNVAKLGSMSWHVVRVLEHELKSDTQRALAKLGPIKMPARASCALR